MRIIPTNPAVYPLHPKLALVFTVKPVNTAPSTKEDKPKQPTHHITDFYA